MSPIGLLSRRRRSLRQRCWVGSLAVVVFGTLLGGTDLAWGADPASDALHWQPLPPLPDASGFAGPFAGVSEDALIVAGGATFVPLFPGPSGPKQCFDTIFVLADPAGAWQAAGKLPRRLAHGLSITTRDGVICGGGSDGEHHTAGVFLLRWKEGEIHTTSLPDLPRPCAGMCGALLGDTVYAAGGIESPNAGAALKTFWALSLTDEPAHWQELEPWPGPERMLAVAAVQDGAFFLVSGIRPRTDKAGKVEHDYLTDAYRYMPGEGWTRLTAVPRPVAAAPSPAPSLGTEHVLMLGGDDGARSTFPALDRQARFSRQVLAYDTRRNAWTVRGQLPFSLIATPPVSWRGYTVVPGGASGPATRSPAVWAAEPVRQANTLGLLDWGTFGAALLALGVIATDLVRRRRTPAVTSSITRLVMPSRRAAVYAWLVVGLLWVVAVLNYLDRQIIYSVFPLLQADLHLSSVQLGLLSTVFYCVYGLLSPFSGFLADRYGRKRVIVGSLLVWSLVTWLTGKASTFMELLGARALMGISEACYLPAALALIVSYHGNRTRSLATGLHQSGLYAGIVLGGVGGSWLGERYGWRWAFLILGAIGIAYVVVLVLTLRENPAGAAGPQRSVPLRFGQALRELAGLPGFGALLLVFSAVATVNTVVYTWLPLYLFEHFQMNLVAAGFSSTFYIQAASLAGILLGGWLADRWSGVAAHGRRRIQALGLLLAGPCLALVGFTTSTFLLIGALIVYGLGRGFYDCNVMPVLSQVARTDLRATGYGVFNLAGCLAGGGVAFLAGALKDAVGLGRVFQLISLFLLASVVLLWRMPARGTGNKVA